MGAVASVAFRPRSPDEVAESVAKAPPMHPMVVAVLGLIATLVALLVASYIAVVGTLLGAERSGWGWFWLIVAVVLAIGVAGTSLVLWLRALSRRKGNL